MAAASPTEAKAKEDAEEPTPPLGQGLSSTASKTLTKYGMPASRPAWLAGGGRTVQLLSTSGQITAASRLALATERAAMDATRSRSCENQQSDCLASGEAKADPDESTCAAKEPTTPSASTTAVDPHKYLSTAKIMELQRKGLQQKHQQRRQANVTLDQKDEDEPSCVDDDNDDTAFVRDAVELRLSSLRLQQLGTVDIRKDDADQSWNRNQEHQWLRSAVGVQMEARQLSKLALGVSNPIRPSSRTTQMEVTQTLVKIRNHIRVLRDAINTATATAGTGPSGADGNGMKPEVCAALNQVLRRTESAVAQIASHNQTLSLRRPEQLGLVASTAAEVEPAVDTLLHLSAELVQLVS